MDSKKTRGKAKRNDVANNIKKFIELRKKDDTRKQS